MICIVVTKLLFTLWFHELEVLSEVEVIYTLPSENGYIASSCIISLAKKSAQN